MNFTRFSKSHILFQNQTSLRPLELSTTSHICPWFTKITLEDQGTRNWVPGASRRRPLPDSGEEAAGVSGERVGRPCGSPMDRFAPVSSVGHVGGKRAAEPGGGVRWSFDFGERGWCRHTQAARGGCRGLCGAVMRLVGGGKAGRQELAAGIDGGRLVSLRTGSRRTL
jgi:hypothetical protein